MYVKSAHQVKQRRPALANMLAALKSHSSRLVSHEASGEPLQWSAQFLEIQEGERRRIATDLHDVIGQSLTMIKLAVEESAQLLGANDAEHAAESLQSLKLQVKNAIEDLRRVSMNLRPAMLDDLGLLATLSCFFREFGTTCRDMKIEKCFDVRENDIPEPLKIVIFRIVQEASNNIAKHAHADFVRVSLKKSGDSIHLSIEDNGDGFDQAATASSRPFGKGVGLSSMKERAELSGGRYALKSAVGDGVRIDISWRVGGLSSDLHDPSLELAAA